MCEFSNQIQESEKFFDSLNIPGKECLGPQSNATDIVENRVIPQPMKYTVDIYHRKNKFAEEAELIRLSKTKSREATE